MLGASASCGRPPPLISWGKIVRFVNVNAEHRAGETPISAPLCLLDSSCGAGHGALLCVSGSDGVDKAASYLSSWALVSLGDHCGYRVKGRCEEGGCRRGDKVTQLTPTLLLIFPLTRLPSLCQPFCPLARASSPRPRWGPSLSPVSATGHLKSPGFQAQV